MSKTGGGPGTNQHRARGQAKQRSKTVCGYPADQATKRGKCMWLRAGFDDIWCPKHRQIRVGRLQQTAPGRAPDMIRLCDHDVCV
jgi:hypothetical protein